MSWATGKKEHWPRPFEDAISEADFFDDDTYAFYMHGTPAPKAGFSRTLRAPWKAAGEVAGIFALLVVVSIFALLDKLTSGPRV